MSNPIEDAKAAIAEARYADAAELLEPLTNGDDAEADYLFGTLLFTGPDVVSRDDAMDALQRAADLDHPAACYCVATTAFDGDGIQTDIVVDAELLVHAGDLGDVDAQRMLGLLHVEGQDGFPEDAEIARAWYERAAEQGDAQSQNDLARMMLEGEGGEVDAENALEWLTACAEQDGWSSERAADLLACIYEEGRYGVEPSEIEATRWRSRQEALKEAAERARVEHEEMQAEIAAAAEAASADASDDREDDDEDDDDGEEPDDDVDERGRS